MRQMPQELGQTGESERVGGPNAQETAQGFLVPPRLVDLIGQGEHTLRVAQDISRPAGELRPVARAVEELGAKLPLQLSHP